MIVAGDLDQLVDSVGGLSAHAEPVLDALGVDADERGLLHRVVDADLLDDTAIALLAGVEDDDPVEGGELLAHALEANLDCHLVELLVLDGLARAGPRWGQATVSGVSRDATGAGRGTDVQSSTAGHSARASDGVASPSRGTAPPLGARSPTGNRQPAGFDGELNRFARHTPWMTIRS